MAEKTILEIVFILSMGAALFNRMEFILQGKQHKKNDLFAEYDLWKKRKCYKKIFGTPNGKRVFKIIK